MYTQIYEGKTTTVIEGTGTLATANYSTSATATEREFDNSEKLWNDAKVSLSCSFTVAPTDQSTVDLIMFEQDVIGDNDEDGPSATSIQGGEIVGNFKLHDTTSQQYQSTVISLFGVKKSAKFSIRNNGGQTMDSDFLVIIEGLSLYEKAG